LTVRIISGERRGANILTPDGFETRPLRDRIRQALFNMLRPDVRGSVVLDAFAGSGAVGLEALSNGAEYVLFVENSKPAAHTVRVNLTKLRYEEQGELVLGPSPQAIREAKRRPAPFTHLLLMPPYESGLCESVLSYEPLLKVCREDCIAVCEIHEDEPFELPAGWKITCDRKYGITRLLFLVRA